MTLGPVTVTPQLYLFNVLDRQTATAYDTQWNLNGSFVTDPSSPFFGQAGLEPGVGSCPAAAIAPCPDNPDYGKITARNNPRLLRVALKVTF
jgi:hypothetical protein